MKKYIVLVLFASVSICNIFAKNHFRAGIVGGLNINKEYRVFDNSDRTVGFHLGGIYEYAFTKNLFLSGSTLFIQKGGKYDYSASFEDKVYHSKYRKNNYYLEVPVHIGYKMPLNHSLSISGSFGPYIGVGLFGKYKVTEGKLQINSNNIYSDKDHKRLDLGIGAKIVLEIHKHYQFSLGYNYGLVKTINDLSDKNRNAMISFGYIF